ncbi:hypothetical protein [Methanoplanus endosymbiosus]|uniref:Uncharacterized protein n=1 Tax=Methanoplanus endosymbiosus TaxID=33865 RepID=A0A9E7TL71_9EURY|nr:hypothetical protein [Methanoplanus endosymbiosus]UUX93509.1 hypothetical protein L6E24_05170 [Methanoplanus endosymbiosus]
MKIYRVKKIIATMLLIMTVVLLISGFGITHYNIIESLTFGILDKPLSYRIHTMTWGIFLILFILHVYFPFMKKK